MFKYYLKTYPLTCVCLVLIWYLCLFKPPRTSLDGIPFIDKWVHISMYLGTCSLMWIEYLRHHRRLSRLRLLVFAVLLPVLMSGVIELVQEYCTDTRSGDWLDFAANSFGVCLAAVLGNTLYPALISRYDKKENRRKRK